MSRIKLLVALIILAMSLTACGTKNDDPDSSVTAEPATETATETAAPEVTATESTQTTTKTLYLVGEQGYSPISFEENGEIVGISPDIIREALGRMGYDVKLELLPWKRCQQMAEDGSADGFFSPYFTEERNEKYLYVEEPLMVEKNVFFVKADSDITFDGDMSKLSEYTIGTLSGYSTLEEYIASGVITKVDYSDTTETAIKKLVTPDRNVDLIVNTNYILGYTANYLGMSDQVKELEVPLAENPSYLAFTKAKDMTAIADEFNKILIEMKSDGSYDLIIEKYVGK